MYYIKSKLVNKKLIKLLAEDYQESISITKKALKHYMYIQIHPYYHDLEYLPKHKIDNMTELYSIDEFLNQYQITKLDKLL